MKPKILIIEDDNLIVALFKESFIGAGLDVEILGDGEKTMQKLERIRKGENEKPDLVLLDMILPDMNGIEILKEARKYPETKDLKIYALTNYSSTESNDALTKEGIDKILIKSQYNLGDLVKIIEEATSK